VVGWMGRGRGVSERWFLLGMGKVETPDHALLSFLFLFAGLEFLVGVHGHHFGSIGLDMT
jgi:hypothetical protein